MEPEHREILRLVQEGKITADEAARLLDAMGDGGGDGEERPRSEDAATEPLSQPVGRPRPSRPAYWLFVLLFGLGWTLAGAALTLWALGTGWMVLTVPFLLVGLAILSLGAASRDATWLSVHVTDSEGRRKFALDFPLPLLVLAWGVRVARPFVPQFRDTAVDELILSLEGSGAGGELLLVDVVDDESGERVQVRVV
jgi:hypothetical protein